MQTTLTGTPGNFEMILHTKRIPVFITATLLFFGILIFLVPFVVIIATGFSPGILFGIAFASFLSFRLIRMVLWNLYGKELITYDSSTFIQAYDYRYFQTKPVQQKGLLKSIGYSAQTTNESDVSEILDAPSTAPAAYVVFFLEDKRHITALPAETAIVTAFFKQDDKE